MSAGRRARDGRLERHLWLVADDEQPLPHPYEPTATPGWPPVRIPGRPGWWRHHIDGQQVDLPHNESPDEESPQ